MLMKNIEKCGDKYPHYKYDEACLNIYNFFNETIHVFGQYVECDECDYQEVAEVPPNGLKYLLVNTKYSLQMHYKHNNSVLCPWNQDLLEHYRYGWNLTEKCTPLYIKEEADNAYIPILTAYIIFMFIGTMWYMVKCIYKCTRDNTVWRRFILRSTEIESDLGSTQESPLVLERPPVKKHPNRLKSIDVFRGFCILLMIFVNYGGGKYSFFEHSVWNGLTFADLVFPWFTWVMGVSMTLSFTNKLRRATPRRQMIAQVVKRSFILIFLGIMVQSHTSTQPLSQLRYCGVLQRLGVCYLITGLLEVSLAKRSFTESRGWLIPEILCAWPQWIFMTSLVVIHTCITFLVDVPGCGKGYLGPGGLHDHGKYENCTGGVTGYIDRHVFGDHIYKNGAYRQIYETTTHMDPEGILGCLTSAFLVFLGIHAGRIMIMYNSTKDKVIRLVVTGFVLCLFGAVLCNFSKNGGVIPMNKKLWSLSFTTVLAGFASFIFAFLHVIVDVTRKWGGRPFFYPGMNPLVLYICHKLFSNFPFAWVPEEDTHAAYLGMNLWGTIVWLCVSIWMYKNNIFISI